VIVEEKHKIVEEGEIVGREERAEKEKIVEKECKIVEKEVVVEELSKASSRSMFLPISQIQGLLE
jgi:hypothetical protein